jgi:endonuclease/exonuclease/phosphatase family metal-dependent hydrolase
MARRPAPDPWLHRRRLAPAGRRAAPFKRPPTRLVRESSEAPAPLPVDLKLLSFNIQAGIRTERYHEYVTRGWRQVLHDPGRLPNLDRIGAVLRGYDLVALQEVDAGSLRSGFTNQVAWLARCAGLPFWYAQRNRRLGRLAQHGNGLLARHEPTDLLDHPLPSTMIPGRGAILAHFDVEDGTPLLLVSAHLSLGPRSRDRQLGWLAEQVAGAARVILMGDLNCRIDDLLERSPLRDTALRPAAEGAVPTYPSWQPRLDLDHVFVSPGVRVEGARAILCQFSDHLPLAVEVHLGAEGGA